MADTTIDPAAVAGLERSTGMRSVLDDLGRRVADDARVLCPKRTGALAASLDHEVDEDVRGLRVRVSWGRAEFYGKFVELGTSRQSAQPFLRAAAAKRRTV